MDIIWIIIIAILAFVGVVILWKLLSAPTDRDSNTNVAPICLSCTNLETSQSGGLCRCLRQDSFLEELGEGVAWDYMAQQLSGNATDCPHFIQDVCSICGAERGTHRSQCPSSSSASSGQLETQAK